MSERPEQIGTVAVYGATGYTGRLVAEELQRRGADFVLAGRSAERLDALAAELGSGARTAAVPVDDPVGLRELLEPCTAVISCAGPFVRCGEPVLAAAIDTGTHYLDTTGEQPYIQMVFDRYGESADRAGVALVPAMGFDYVPGDMIAALTAAGMGPLRELVVAYAVRGFGASRGTMRSALEIIGGGDVEYRDGAWRPGSHRVDRGTWEFPPPVGAKRMVRYPSGEQITVPRHVETRTVSALLSADTAMQSSRLAPAAPVAVPLTRLAMSTPLRRLADAAISRLPEGPGEEARRASRFMIVCEARIDGGTRRRGTVTGSDVYGLTAATIVRGALLASAPDYEGCGALAPSQAFDPAEFMFELGALGVEHDVEPLPRTAPAAAAGVQASSE
jgi:short subunit dehydrogenase-like uncharacterized protein